MAIGVVADSLMSRAGLGLGGRISVEFSELHSIAGGLRGVADRYESASQRLLALTTQVGLLASLDMSGHGATAAATLGASGTALWGLVATMQKLADGVRRSAENYEAAEAFAVSLLHHTELTKTAAGRAAQAGYESAFGYVTGTLAFMVYKGKVLVDATPKASREYLRHNPQGQKLMKDATGALNQASAQLGITGRLRATRDVSHIVSPQPVIDHLEPGRSIPTSTPHPLPTQVPLTYQDMADHLLAMSQIENRADDLHTAGNFQGEWDHVLVQTLHNPETGETQYLVTIPGTDGDLLPGSETWDPLQQFRGGTNSWGGTFSNSAAGDSPDLPPEQYTAMMQQVDEALKAAGAPDGANVSLMGFSQGGIVATTLAANTAFNSRYRLKFLGTQGSPIDHIKPKDGLIHLDMRYEGDFVPSLSPDRKDYRPTRSHTLTRKPEGAGSHGAQEYADMAALDAATHRPVPELVDAFGGYEVKDVFVFAGTTQKPTITRSEQAMMGIAGVANFVNASGQQLGTPIAPLIDSTNVNPANFLQDIDDLMGDLEEDFINPVDEWIDQQAEGTNIFGVEIHNPRITLPPSNEPPPAPHNTSGITVYEATTEHHLQNLVDVAGLGRLPLDGLVDTTAELVDRGIEFFHTTQPIEPETV
ncbi:hypothetical protein [Rothia nasimurium]|uniref:hypothetical protein n=1 Tax=Rothia nasimurium TaxID=85336 RepID=UPI001F433FD7|nr:hypothetical protein [Rothia nasimurium]